MRLTKIFTFDAAHFLTQYHGKCENVHGHTYRLEVTVEGPVGVDGLVMDFAELKTLIKEKVLNKLDHSHLNDHFENPSAELVAMWIWDQVKDGLPEGVSLAEVKLFETPESFVTYNGNI